MVSRTTLVPLAFAAALAAGCGPGPAPDAPAPADGKPHRVVALTCGAVDTISVLGALDQVIAVEEDCPAPGTEDKVKIRNDDHPGQFQQLNVESVLALHPDAVIAKSSLRPALENRGLNVLWSPDHVNLRNLDRFVLDVGAFVGAPDEARRAMERFHEKEAELRRRTADLPKVRVYYETTGPGRTAGALSVIHGMIDLSGGVNVAGDQEKPDLRLTPEAVVAADPEVIVLWSFAEEPEVVAARQGWENVAAVRNGRIHKIPVDRRFVMLGSPRCVEGCEEMLLPWIHPELAASEGGGGR